MKKIKVAILFGGASPEYSVSLVSAHAVISHLDTTRFDPVLVGISHQGDWYHFTGDIQKIKEDTWCNETDCVPAALSPNRLSHHLVTLSNEGADKIAIDVAFPVLHGKNGEDGTVQGLFELAGIPLVGCNTLSSALCIDKDRAHKLAASAGVRVPHSFVLDENGALNDAFAAGEELGYPLFVKPMRAGSSFGISKISAPEELSGALEAAFAFDNKVIIEQHIEGFEVGCAVMGNDEVFTGEIDEIELSHGFFDYQEKYSLKTSAIHVPARITEQQAARIKETAMTLYRALGCSGFARVDMFLEPSGDIVFNEINTIPGFTPQSRFPSMLKAAGHSFDHVISHAIELAIA